MKTIFTIGHSIHTLDNFTNLLKKYNIDVVIDVRSMPYSKYVDWFDKENLFFFLKKNNFKIFKKQIKY
ncbi:MULTISPECIES: DUF488 family protein [unclassified Lebetimonas]|uniref:DUF488 family protein n=1 Tax=unclassified Lebetimonas TaxID=2648158 RepID=UPI00046576A9